MMQKNLQTAFESWNEGSLLKSNPYGERFTMAPWNNKGGQLLGDKNMYA
jgi:hypothetical protein